jgi:hypothetical protein
MILSRNQFRFRGLPDQEQHAADRATPTGPERRRGAHRRLGQLIGAGFDETKSRNKHSPLGRRLDRNPAAFRDQSESTQASNNAKAAARLAGLQLARLSNGGDYCTESSPVSDRQVQGGVGKLPRAIAQSSDCDRSEAQISHSPEGSRVAPIVLVALLHRSLLRIRATRKSGSYDLAYSARPRRSHPQFRVPFHRRQATASLV